MNWRFFIILFSCIFLMFSACLLHNTSGIFIPVVLAQRVMKCLQCGKNIKSGDRYLRANDGKIFCGKQCYARYFERAFPRCAICRRIVTKGYSSKDGKKSYCSMECLKKTWPKCSLCGTPAASGIMIGGSDGKFFCPQCAAKPKCFCCDLPGNCSKLTDGRDICAKCAETAVMDMDAALPVINDVRKTMRDRFNLYTEHDIKFKLIDIDKLKKLTPVEHTGMELGLYHYQETIEETVLKGTSIWGKVISKTKDRKREESYIIFLLYGMSKQKLIEVTAHELGHDWMQEFYPNIREFKIKEGWAEYVAFLVNEAYGQKYMNSRINDNPDYTYGDGFRMIRDIVEKDGMNGLENLFDEQNKKQ